MGFLRWCEGALQITVKVFFPSLFTPLSPSRAVLESFRTCGGGTWESTVLSHMISSTRDSKHREGQHMLEDSLMCIEDAPSVHGFQFLLCTKTGARKQA
ncbi:hypothetical protein ACSAZL_09005 [Methanosarcina sp. T3]|uniref:hypothetical protein n=1 Tax=Methanosarcina sp. T3 TaxID=3439062 RepID=UPI003F87C7F7